MYALVLSLHILICFGLIMVVLLQSGKGGGLAGGAFGGTAQTVFGGRGATDFMTRATMVLGAAFFATSLAMALMSTGAGRPTRSLIQEEARRAPAAAPQVPGGSTPAQTPSQQQAPSQQAPAPAQTPAPAPATKPGGGH
jgi:preprotein translocase subunit SecG